MHEFIEQKDITPKVEGYINQDEASLYNDVESVRDLKGGANKPELIKLKDDGLIVFKAQSKENPEIKGGIECGTYYKRERAAYLVDNYLGFNLVPPTVIREVRGQIGSAQKFIPDATTRSMLCWDKIPKDNLARLAIFDIIISNADRHGGNYLLTSDGKINAIDNGQTFKKRSRITFSDKDLLEEAGVPDDIVSNLENFLANSEQMESLRKLLLELLSPKEVENFYERIPLILKFIKKHQQVITRDFLEIFAFS